MPHSVSPESSQQEGALPSAPSLNASQDVEMGDGGEPSPTERKETVHLEDMFDNDDDDEEFPASSPPKVKLESSPPPQLLYVVYLLDWKQHLLTGHTENLHRRQSIRIQRSCELFTKDFFPSDISSSG